MPPIGDPAVLAANGYPPPAPPASPDALREKQASESRRALVKSLTDVVRAARTFWNPIFERMREDMDFASGDQWHDATDTMSDRYQANFVQRQLNQQVSVLYAKNPTFTAERRRRLEYTAWDGTETSLQQAKAAISQAAQADLAATQAGQKPNGPPPEAAAIVTDYARGAARKKRYDNIAETLELLFAYELDSQSPDFETQMKDLLLREKTVGVGFVTAKFQSEHESVPTAGATQANIIERLNQVHALAATLAADPSRGEDDPAHEELRLAVLALAQSVQSGEGKTTQQGVLLDFHPATGIIVDPKCRNLCEFVGADWITEEMLFDPEQVLAQWNVDVKKDGAGVIRYQHGKETGDTVNLKTKAGGEEKEKSLSTGPWPEQAKVCVWTIQHKRDQMRYVVLDGYKDFLEEPEAPWPAVQGFWHTVALKLTRVEVEENKPQQGVTCYGTSTCRLLRPMQQEMNRSQEALREHRVANRPGHVCGKDTFTEGDRRNLSGRAAHAVVPLDNVQPGADCSKVLFPIPVNHIDPDVYRTDGIMQHAMLVAGSQQANIGEQQSNEKATGQAIAEQSRVQSVNSEADSQDKFLATLARISGEMMLLAMDPAIVKQKVGFGAAWPVGAAQREQVRQHLFLRVDAGSTGRPNRALEIANLQALMPQLLELARNIGLPLDPLVKYAARVMDFDFDIQEWLGQAQPPQGSAGKPASEAISINLAQLTPDERAQALAMAGIKASSPQAVAQPGAPGAAPQGMPAGVAAQATRMLPK